MHDSLINPANTATRSLEDFFATMDYQSLPLESLPAYERYQLWQAHVPAPYFVNDFVGDIENVEDVVSHARQACTAWAALPLAERRYQLFTLLATLQEESEMLSILESDISEMPLRFGRDVYFPALWRDFSAIEVGQEGSSSIQLLRADADIALILRHWWQGLARGCASIIVGERSCLKHIAQLWQEQQLPQGLLALVPVGWLEPLLSKVDIIPNLSRPQHDTAIISAQADSASSLQLLAQRAAALPRPLHLLVQEAVLPQVKAQLEQTCAALRQGHPLDEASDGKTVQLLAAELPVAALPQLEAHTIALTSFRRLSDVKQYLHKVRQLSFWSQDYEQVLIWQKEQGVARVSLNQLDIAPVTETIYPPASLKSTEASAVADRSEQQSFTSAAFITRPPEAMRNIFYQQSASCKHREMQCWLREYAGIQVAGRQARGDITLLISCEMSLMSLAHIALAILRMGNRLTIRARNQATAWQFSQAVPALAVSLSPFGEKEAKGEKVPDATVWAVGAAVAEAAFVVQGCPEEVTGVARGYLLEAASLEHSLNIRDF